MCRLGKSIICVGLFLATFPFLVIGAETISAQKAEADAAQLVKDLDTLRNAMQGLQLGGARQKVAATTDKGEAGATDQSAEALAKLAQFEKDVLAPTQARFDDYVKNYGNSRAAIDDKFKQILGRALRRRPSWAWEMLGPELEKARGMRSKLAGELVTRAKRTLKFIPNLNKDIWARSFDEAKGNLEAALKINPKDEEAKTLLDGIDKQKSEALAKLEEEIEKAEWKPHSPKFKGPGDPDELARIAFEDLRMDNDGNISDSVLAVRINGDWRVWDEVLGIPKNYGLPVEVAYKIKDEPQNAKVLRLTMVTRDAKKAPPFGPNPGVGDSYKIRRNKIPGMAGGSAAPFVLFRLGLAAALILAGIMAGSSLFQSLNPGLGAVIEKIVPLKAVVGVITLAVGVLFFVKNLLCLSPLADVLPQIAAVVIGLLLGLELLLKAKIPSSASGQAGAPESGSAAPADASEEPKGAESTSKQLAEAAEKTKEAGEAAAQKLQDVLAKQEEKIKSLRQHQVRLGIVCIALGLLHLAAAGWWLF